jgi:hypothetical protein
LPPRNEFVIILLSASCLANFPLRQTALKLEKYIFVGRSTLLGRTPSHDDCIVHLTAQLMQLNSLLCAVQREI